MEVCPKCGVALAGSEEICACGQWFRRAASGTQAQATTRSSPQPHQRESAGSVLKSYGTSALVLLAALVVGVVAKDFAQRATQPKPPNPTALSPSQISSFLGTYNSALPKRVDEVTVLERVTFEQGNVLRYHYALSEADGAQPAPQALLRQIRAKHIQQYCVGSQTEPLRRQGVSVAQTYYRAGKILGTVTAGPADCL